MLRLGRDYVFDIDYWDWIKNDKGLPYFGWIGVNGR